MHLNSNYKGHYDKGNIIRTIEPESNKLTNDGKVYVNYSVEVIQDQSIGLLVKMKMEILHLKEMTKFKRIIISLSCFGCKKKH